MAAAESLCVDKVSSNLACTGHGSRHNCTNVGAKHGAQSVHPFTLVESYLQTVTKSIKEDLRAVDSELLDVSEYYFDGQGKLFRPMLVMLMAKAVNFHTNQMDSLMHDDVIDAADSRRGKPSINQVFGHRKITEDLVRGEFMQLGSKEKEDERFTHYLNKSFKKTASLLANSCKAVAILSHCDEGIEEIAYDYGKNVGISFQLIDDLLDFTSCDLVMGKPTAADLRLGLATAPSDGIEQTRQLAHEHSAEAVRQIRTLTESRYVTGLEMLANIVLSRKK
ncbi:DPS1-like protein [Mya arenaria]|uniref:DPS1-like protein n=1 Tax=Mya arenaria TaxID=6604 RepID=A0ABY7EB72_MYAAR|nr:DPS1-like protein [Mya arenaria]